MTTPDVDARTRVLTDFEANVLVEAAAGTGKTSLMAGRRDDGRQRYSPRNCRYYLYRTRGEGTRRADTLDGRRARRADSAGPFACHPQPLRETEASLEAAGRHDEITATTIHGFCQGILRAHGLAAGLDPGSRVIDAIIADALFDEVLSDLVEIQIVARSR